MGFNKGHMEFTTLNLNEGFHNVPGYPSGFPRGSWPARSTRRTRSATAPASCKIEPGAYSTVPFVHEYWEEVFLVSGDLVCGSDDKGQGGEQFTGPTYCVRPPGVYHGPFTSKTGCYPAGNALLRGEVGDCAAAPRTRVPAKRAEASASRDPGCYKEK